MDGHTLAAMSDAIENAALFLVCMSEMYKESAQCRTGEQLSGVVGSPVRLVETLY